MNIVSFRWTLLFCLLPLALTQCQRSAIRLSREGLTNYHIVLPQNPDPSLQQAADELQSYLKQASGADFTIVQKDEANGENEIILAKTGHCPKGLNQIDFDTLKKDGFSIHTSPDQIIIAGGTEKGCLYGVFEFLESCLGCRMYTPDCIKVPKSNSLIIKPYNTIQLPAFDYREAYLPASFQSNYANWHRLDNVFDRKKAWGMYVHTFDDMVPAENYFDEHPEYFSEQNGHRIPNGQLCLAQPEVKNIIVRELKKRIQEYPEARYWSVSQNDNYNQCQCEKCQALNKKYGGPSGTLLHFVNDIAREFPDKTISTLAYQYSRQAPKNILPENNVNIMLCSIECNRSRPIATDPKSAGFRKDVEEWSALTSNIYLWDYVVQFRNYISPFPNLHVLQPNIQFFRDHQIQMMFQQGSSASRSEFHELRAYLISKLLWNPDADVDGLTTDFLNGYYGAAGPYLHRYIENMQQALKKSGASLNIYGYPYDGIKGYLSPDQLKQYTRLFDQAEKAVNKEPKILKRVQTARLPLEFAILRISIRNVDDELSFFDRKNNMEVKPEMREKLLQFVNRCIESGIERIEEHGTTPIDFLHSMQKMMEIEKEGNLAYDKCVLLDQPANDQYPAGGPRALTNGLHGPADYHCNWLGFQGKDMVATIDLEVPKTIHEIKATFLQEPYAWIWLPDTLTVSTSNDGIHYSTPVARAITKIKKDTQGALTHTFRLPLHDISARFVKVTAKNQLVCPEWHIGSGQPAWIFCDEIEVR